MERRTVLVKIEHAVVEFDTKTSFYQVLDLAKKGRIILVQLNKMARVFDNQLGVGGVR